VSGFTVALALVMLYGCGLYALAAAAVCTAFLVRILSRFGVDPVISFTLSGLASLLLLLPLLDAFRGITLPPKGISVNREDAPGLWSLVDQSAAALGGPTPDTILIDNDTNLGMWTQDRRGNKQRTLVVGAPLLAMLSVGQIRALSTWPLSFEPRYQKWPRNHVHLGHLGLRRALQRFYRQPWNPMGLLLLPGIAAYFAVSTKVTRAGMFATDRDAARLAGGENSRTALREIPALDRIWESFQERHLKPGIAFHLMPSDVLGGFIGYCETRAADLAEYRDNLPTGKPPWGSTHPTFAERVAALEGVEGEPRPGDEAPASVLVDRFGQFAAQADLMRADHTVKRIPWETWEERVAREKHSARAAAAYRSLERLLGPERSGLEALIAEVESNDRDRLFLALDEKGFPAGGLDSILILAALDSKALRIETRWGEAPAYIGADGRPFDLEALRAPLFAAEPDPRRFRELLAERGVDLTLAVPVATVSLRRKTCNTTRTRGIFTQTRASW